MIKYEDIGRAASELDQEARGISYEKILENFGLGTLGAVKAAHQRALRMWQIDHNLPLGDKTPVPDSELLTGASVWLDGLVIGMRLGLDHVLANNILPDDQHRTSKQ